MWRGVESTDGVGVKNVQNCTCYHFNFFNIIISTLFADSLVDQGVTHIIIIKLRSGISVPHVYS